MKYDSHYNMTNKQKRELMEETLKKLDIDEEDLKELEKIRGEVWKKEKRNLRLSSS